MPKNGKAFTPRRTYNFARMKAGGKKEISITKLDPKAGIRALTAAYAFARRNKGVRFAGRTNKAKTILTIHRVK